MRGPMGRMDGMTSWHAAVRFYFFKPLLAYSGRVQDWHNSSDCFITWIWLCKHLTVGLGSNNNHRKRKSVVFRYSAWMLFLLHIVSLLCTLQQSVKTFCLNSLGAVDYTEALYHFSSVSYDFPHECIHSRCWLLHVCGRKRCDLCAYNDV